MHHYVPQEGRRGCKAQSPSTVALLSLPIRLREHKQTQQLYSSLGRPAVLHLHRLHHACVITAAQLECGRSRERQYTRISLFRPLCCCGIRWPGAQRGCRHRNVTIGTSCRDCCATAVSFMRSDSACMQLRTAIPRSICRCSPHLTGTTSILPPIGCDSAHHMPVRLYPRHLLQVPLDVTCV